MAVFPAVSLRAAILVELSLDRPVAPFLDSGVDLLVSSLTVEGLTRVPHSASVMSSTRRTLTPAKYISIRASSTLLSRRLYRSIICVSNGKLRNFGTCRVTSPAFVCSLRS